MKFSSFSISNFFKKPTVICMSGVFWIYLLFLPFWVLFGNIFEKLNLEIQNSLYNTAAIFLSQPNSSVVVVEIDEATLKNKNEGGLGRWQDFSREYYDTTIKNLIKANVGPIGIDILLSEDSKNTFADINLQKTLKKQADKIVLGFHHFDKNPNEDIKTFGNNNPKETGFVNIRKNEINRTVYAINSSEIIDNKSFFSFSFLLAQKYFIDLFWNNFKNEDIFSEQFPLAKNLFNKNTGLPFYIQFFNPKESTTFTTISFKDAYFNTIKNPKNLEGKIILIGATATALGDTLETPVGNIPGVYIHALALQTLFSNQNITFLPMLLEIVSGILFLLCLIFITLNIKKPLYSGLIFFGNIGFLFTIQLVFFLFSGKLFHFFSEILFLSILGFLFSYVFQYLQERHSKGVLKNALVQYISEDIANEILQQGSELSLGGKKKVITSCFSDIAGFTRITEGMDPQRLLDFLSVYLKQMSDIIWERRGFINKYEGDAIMSLWGVFSDEKEQAYLACQSALDQHKKLQELNIFFQENFGFSIQVRLGINTGEAIIGNIGSLGKKVEFTALGDSINTASRLEGINKYYGTFICVSENTTSLCQDQFFFRHLDTVYLKGKQNPSKLFELIDEQWKTNEQKKYLVTQYEKALKLYQAGDFNEASLIFDTLVQTFQDGPSSILKMRCFLLQTKGCGENWNGVWEMHTK